MLARKLRCTPLIGLLCSLSSLVMAGTFTPDSGTPITSTNVSIGWTSTDSEQWVRAYDTSGSKIFDSGRQSSSTGQVSFTIAASATGLQVFFYEKDSTGSWVSNERTYSVSIGGTDGGADGSGDTTGTISVEDHLADLGCSPGQHIQSTATEAWECVDPVAVQCPVAIVAMYASLRYSHDLTPPLFATSRMSRPSPNTHPNCGWAEDVVIPPPIDSTDQFENIQDLAWLRITYPQDQIFDGANDEYFIDVRMYDTDGAEILNINSLESDVIDACAITIGCPTLAEWEASLPH